MTGQYYVSKKYNKISLLAEETAGRIVKNADEWIKYLSVAARLYRYPFEEQLLIYAQRPDAVACATIEQWNEKMFCWVNRGAKGIALLDRESKPPRLKYVFDVSDVHKTRVLGKELYLWALKDEQKDEVLIQLEKTYGKLDRGVFFEENLIEIAGRLAEESYMELLPQINYLKEGSFLEELDDLNIGIRIRETLSASIACTLLCRCGADMETWKDALNFEFINEFNTMETVTVVGNATSEICQTILMEIGRMVAVRDFVVAWGRKRGAAAFGKEFEKQIANMSRISYNALKRKSADGIITDRREEREAGEHGTDIREEWRVPDTKPDSQQRTGRTADKVRDDAGELSKGTNGRNLQGNAPERDVEGALSGDTDTGRAEDGVYGKADGRNPRGGRENESIRPDEMGGRNEQNPALGRGEHSGRAHLQSLANGKQLNTEIPEPGNGESSLPGSSNGSMKFQKAILRHDEFRIHKRAEIAGYFAVEQDAWLQTDYLKNSFRMEQYTEFDIGSIRVGYRADEDGLTMWKGHYLSREAEERISWADVRYLVNSYIETGEYLFSGEVAEHIEVNGTYQQLSLFPMLSEQVRKVKKPEKQKKEQQESGESYASELLEKEIVRQTSSNADFSDAVEVHDGVDKSNADNFRIMDDSLGVGTAKEKFQRNVKAIRTLEKIEGENRVATLEEQRTLSQYVGWGGLADVFDEGKGAWADEYQELKSLLSPQEYVSARESTLNAHYTTPLVIRSIYEALDRMGFEKGNILEPAMGIGNFFGVLPEKMQESRLYGVELDSISGRIARQLYPKADIKISAFEKTEYPNDFFDVAVGNVPFGNYGVADKVYDKYGFKVHDYFFAKTLAKVRPGGIIAFITSKGTMDKKNTEVRRYLAQRAELLGAVRLPNTAFKKNAGTEVTADILFLKKRDRIVDIEPDWIYLTEKDGIVMNQYFADHPDMIVGKMEVVSGAYGMESICQPDTSRTFESQLAEAVGSIAGEIGVAEMDEIMDDLTDTVLADPDVKNYSYTLIDGKVYYRENSIMKHVDVPDTTQARIRGMVGIRDCAQGLINLQMQEYPETAIKIKQSELNRLYDSYSKKYGRLNSRSNKRAFRQDSSYCLLCSLEKLDDEGKFKEKADMFFRRTIKKAEVVTSVDTASEALAVSLSEKAKVDLDYMAELVGKDVHDIQEKLAGVIFRNPVTDRWETADEYLSGNVRDKLATAKIYARNHPEYHVNVDALMGVQPKELDASEIEAHIGATWIDARYMEDFMRDIFETPQHLFDKKSVSVMFSEATGQWKVAGKNEDNGNPHVKVTYGTKRRNAYTILEDSLNLKESQVYDRIEEDGKEKRVLNKKETILASQKQEAIREAFKDWVFRDPQRRQDLVRKYNELFNSIRPREYDGSHLKFPGMTPDIKLKEHQLNAVAHQLYGNNTLLAHCVGAGKTFEMVAAAMESKRLGLCEKSMFVVPNHLTEQWASDFLRLYPGANILAATKKDFEPVNRKKFCSRIATGNYDAVIIGHSQFEKIPLSWERQAAIIERQINEIELVIAEEKADKGERYTVKQMEKLRKTLQVRLQKLNDTEKKDDVVTFEQLGVDRLFVDESHFYKNLFLYTKMKNVAGIPQTEAQKSSDMFAKCQYMDELTGGKGITFATGTPISNSMTELYTNMRYLQYGTLQKLGLGHFDSWASSFGEMQTAIELAPEGTGYRAKTRMARFYNLPELISIFKESADIKTADMLNLPVPEAEYENVLLQPSEYQKDIVESLADRAEDVRNRAVRPEEDNLLRITNDGRKLALDQRLINDMLPDYENSKASVCAKKAFEIWEQTMGQRSTQIIFCDLSTPKKDGTFNIYDDIKDKLIKKGVPAKEIAFIHEANTELQKMELFGKVRSGQVRFLFGSTQKMGAGTNVQDRLIALHHLDIPWRPADIQQQEGRILRQGNLNAKVKIFRYITEGTFDSYSWQVIENKQKFISQIMTSKSPVRSCADVDEAALTYAEIKALSTGNPYIKEKMELDIEVSKLKLMKAEHTSQKYRLEDNITRYYPWKIAELKERVSGLKGDIQVAEHNLSADSGQFFMKVGDKHYTDKKEAGVALVELCREKAVSDTPAVIGEYAGFSMEVCFDSYYQVFKMELKGLLRHTLELGSDPSGNIVRINHALESMTGELASTEEKLASLERQFETAKVEVEKPFAKETELEEKLERLSTLNALLNIDEKGSEAAGMDEVEESEQETPECLPKQEETPAIVNHTEKPHKPVKKESLRERMNVFREQRVKGGRADEEKTGEIEETL